MLFISIKIFYVMTLSMGALLFSENNYYFNMNKISLKYLSSH